MREIPLTQGYVAIGDDEDYECVSTHKWTALIAKRKHGTVVYGYRRENWDNSRRRWLGMVLLHRFVLDAPHGISVDHRDGNGLNCCRYNLRLATKRLNATNILRALPKSGYRGVFFDHERQLYRAEADKKYLGRYATAEEAARAYDIHALLVFGEFAKPNFPIEHVAGSDMQSSIQQKDT